jgi:DNA repair exonuclease SbcCD nuclease subunit
MVLIAGDLFDSGRVGDDAIDATVKQLARLDKPVVVIPGNHDCIDEYSIYHRVDLRTAGDHVFLAANPAGEELIFDDYAVSIWARGIENHEPAHRPLEGCPSARPGYWRIVLTHGHYVPAGALSDRSSQISEEEISSLECDFLALGHWHHFVDVSAGDVRACYSGSPSHRGGDGPAVNLVRLAPAAGVLVERRVIAF